MSIYRSNFKYLFSISDRSSVVYRQILIKFDVQAISWDFFETRHLEAVDLKLSDFLKINSNNFNQVYPLETPKT